MRARSAARGPSPEVTALVEQAETLLGGTRPADRLEGVQAVVRLADVSPPHRQACVSVLGAYLRQPYDPDSRTPGEEQVRRAALDAIRDHLQDPASPTTWCGLDIDLSDATLDGGSLTGIQLTGGTLRLARTRVVHEALDLTGARIAGGVLSLERATIATRLLLDRVSVSAGRISLDRVVLERGGSISMEHGRFFGGHLTVVGAQLGRGRFSLRGSKVEGGFITFNGSTLGGADLCFDDAEILSGGCYLTNLMVTSGTITFRGARIARPALSLRMSTLTGGRLSLDGARPLPGPGGEVASPFEGMYLIPPAEVSWGAWAPADGVVIDLREEAGTPRPIPSDQVPSDQGGNADPDGGAQPDP